jgi:hypothetical protein
MTMKMKDERGGADQIRSDCIFLENHIITIAVPWMDG